MAADDGHNSDMQPLKNWLNVTKPANYINQSDCTLGTFLERASKMAGSNTIRIYLNTCHVFNENYAFNYNVIKELSLAPQLDISFLLQYYGEVLNCIQCIDADLRHL